MYAIRSYYERQQKARAREADKQRKRQLRFERHASTVQTDDLHLPDEVADAIVITSYSIHYTTLYEPDCREYTATTPYGCCR